MTNKAAIENMITSISAASFIFNKFVRLNPPNKKYNPVLIKERKVDWFARVVRCMASSSRSTNSGFVANGFDIADCG